MRSEDCLEKFRKLQVAMLSQGLKPCSQDILGGSVGQQTHATEHPGGLHDRLKQFWETKVLSGLLWGWIECESGGSGASCEPGLLYTHT